MKHSDESGVATSWVEFQRSKIYDVLAASPMIAWFGLSGLAVARLIATRVAEARFDFSDPLFAISILSQLAAFSFIVLLLMFVVLRRPAKAKAKGLMPRLAALLGTYLGVAVVWLPPQPMSLSVSLASLALTLAGMGFSIHALSHLGRSFSLMAEARQLVTDGPYGKVRHPLYLGEAVSVLGLTLQYLSPAALLIYALQLSFQLIRMKNEERVLEGLFPEYASYRERTARLLPGIY